MILGPPALAILLGATCTFTFGLGLRLVVAAGRRCIDDVGRRGLRCSDERVVNVLHLHLRLVFVVAVGSQTVRSCAIRAGIVADGWIAGSLGLRVCPFGVVSRDILEPVLAVLQAAANFGAVSVGADVYGLGEGEGGRGEQGK